MSGTQWIGDLRPQKSRGSAFAEVALNALTRMQGKQEEEADLIAKQVASQIAGLRPEEMVREIAKLEQINPRAAKKLAGYTLGIQESDDAKYKREQTEYRRQMLAGNAPGLGGPSQRAGGPSMMQAPAPAPAGPPQPGGALGLASLLPGGGGAPQRTGPQAPAPQQQGGGGGYNQTAQTMGRLIAAGLPAQEAALFSDPVMFGTLPPAVQEAVMRIGGQETVTANQGLVSQVERERQGKAMAEATMNDATSRKIAEMQAGLGYAELGQRKSEFNWQRDQAGQSNTLRGIQKQTQELSNEQRKIVSDLNAARRQVEGAQKRLAAVKTDDHDSLKKANEFLMEAEMREADALGRQQSISAQITSLVEQGNQVIGVTRFAPRGAAPPSEASVGGGGQRLVDAAKWQALLAQGFTEQQLNDSGIFLQGGAPVSGPTPAPQRGGTVRQVERRGSTR